MKRISALLAFLLIMVTASTAFAGSDTLKDRKSIGFQGTGHYTITSYESVFFNFATTRFQVAGAGFNAFFEYGLSDRFSFSGHLGYQRLLYSSFNRNVITENFFTIDAMGHYYFTSGSTIQPYASFGGGALISTRSVAPTLNVGVGAHFFVADQVSIKTDLLLKTAFIHNQVEAGVGVGFHF